MDASKLKAGDVVTVRATVKTTNVVGGVMVDSASLHDEECFIFVAAADILSIEPRPIAVGDRVMHRDSDHAALVEWRDEQWALLRFEVDGPDVAPSIKPLSTLTRADASDE